MTTADEEVAVLWLAEQMGLEPDPVGEPGVWMATRMGRVLRLPEHCDAVLRRLLAECKEFGCHDDGTGPL